MRACGQRGARRSRTPSLLRTRTNTHAAPRRRRRRRRRRHRRRYRHARSRRRLHALALGGRRGRRAAAAAAVGGRAARTKHQEGVAGSSTETPAGGRVARACGPGGAAAPGSPSAGVGEALNLEATTHNRRKGYITYTINPSAEACGVGLWRRPRGRRRRRRGACGRPRARAGGLCDGRAPPTRPPRSRARAPARRTQILSRTSSRGPPPAPL